LDVAALDILWAQAREDLPRFISERKRTLFQARPIAEIATAAIAVQNRRSRPTNTGS